MHKPALITMAILVLIASTAAAPKPREKGALELARRIALAAHGDMEGHRPGGHGALRTAEASPDIEQLRRRGPEARRELERVVAQHRNHTDTAAAAYGLYLLDREQAPKSVETLLRQMRATGFVDLMLVDTLIQKIGRDAVPTLVGHLGDQMVVDLLGAMGDEASGAVPALRRLLGPDNVPVAAALARIGTEEAVGAAKPVLLAAAAEPDGPYTKDAVIAVGELGEKARDAVPALRRSLSSTNPDVRVRAAVALAKVGDTEFAVRALGQLIEDEELHERSVALRALADLGPQAKDAVEPLIRVAADKKEKRSGDRALAAIALKRIDPQNPRAMAALKQAASVPEIRRQIERAEVKPP